MPNFVTQGQMVSVYIEDSHNILPYGMPGLCFLLRSFSKQLLLFIFIYGWIDGISICILPYSASEAMTIL